MRLIFIGIHNKPGLPPLCSTTKTGQIVDAIICNVGYWGEVVRSNLFEVDYLPSNIQEIDRLKTNFFNKYAPSPNDVIVMLGQRVRDFLPVIPAKWVIKAFHPAAIRDKAATERYVSEVSAEILYHLSNY